MHMGGDGVRELYVTLMDPTASVVLGHLGLRPTSEGGCDQEIAGQKHSERNDYPFQAHESYRKYLKSVFIAHPLKIFCCLHCLIINTMKS